MKKLKYYAPYWVSAIVVIAIILTIVLLRRREPPTLYDYALTMESSDYFLRDDRSLWQFSEELYNGYIKIKPTGESSKKVKNYTDKEKLEQMSLYEFALAAYDTVYIRQDGSVWISVGTASTKLPDYAVEIKAIDYELAPASPPELSAAIVRETEKSIDVFITNEDNYAIPPPYAYLFVQLEDGKWYIHRNAFLHSVMVHDTYVFDGEEVEISHDLQPGSTHVFKLNLPISPLTYRRLTGRYCVAVFSNAHYDRNRSGEHAIYTTYPISENAELIAAVEFDLSASNGIDFDLTNFTGSIENISTKRPES